MNRLAEINKSVDYHNLEAFNKDGVGNRFPSIANTDIRNPKALNGKFGFLSAQKGGVNQSVDMK